MTAVATYAKLLSLKISVIRTSEAAAVLGVSPVAAAQSLRRLAKAGLVQPLRQGMVWLSREPIDPWIALEFVSAPYPAYASLYSALYLHGSLSQIPAVHYAVTLGRTQRVSTRAGTYSLHRLAPSLFEGFDTLASGAKLATLEKALFDLAYLGATRSRLFSRPPELELPRNLDRPSLRDWVDRIDDARRATRVRMTLEEVLRRSGRRL